MSELALIRLERCRRSRAAAAKPSASSRLESAPHARGPARSRLAVSFSRTRTGYIACRAYLAMRTGSTGWLQRRGEAETVDEGGGGGSLSRARAVGFLFLAPPASSSAL